MNAQIDATLRRVGRGKTSHFDEADLRDYIGVLEKELTEVKEGYRDQSNRVRLLANRLAKLEFQLRGPGAGFVVFLPGGQNGDDLHAALTLREMSDAVLREIGERVATAEGLRNGG